MRIEKKGRINTKTRKHLPMEQSFFQVDSPFALVMLIEMFSIKNIKSSNDDDDGQVTSGNDIDY